MIKLKKRESLLEDITRSYDDEINAVKRKMEHRNWCIPASPRRGAPRAAPLSLSLSREREGVLAE